MFRSHKTIWTIRWDLGTYYMWDETLSPTVKSFLLTVPRRYFVWWSFVLFMSLVCHAFVFVHCYLVVTWRERADLLALVCDIYCNFVTFPFGILGQVWYLFASIPDPYCLFYFKPWPRLLRRFKSEPLPVESPDTYNMCRSLQYTSMLRVRLALWHRLKPSSEYFTDRSMAMLLLWIVFVIHASCWCVLCCRVCSLHPCGHLLGKGWPLGCSVCCVFLCFVTSQVSLS